MSRITLGLLAGALLACCAANAQTLADWNLANPPTAPVGAMTPSVSSGKATVYIEESNGFEDYLAAAFRQKSVPLAITMNKDEADYVIVGVSKESRGGWAHALASWELTIPSTWLDYPSPHTDDATALRMYDRRTGRVVYAYAADKKYSWHGQQTVAEAFAKHLDHWIKDGH